MIERSLYRIAFSDSWGRQMRFITGPRQSGKTTLAKQKLQAEESEHLYYLWDLRSIRQRYKQNELFFTADGSTASGTGLWVCFDEIHKMPRWKNILKSAFDETADRYRFIITGSAKLNILRHAGDSLAGRYFTFHLMPLTLKEVIGSPEAAPPQSASEFIGVASGGSTASQDMLTDLLAYSGFPEPFLQQAEPFHKKWSHDYIETVINEDIGSLTRIVDREYLFDLYNLLPGMTGNPLSYTSLAAHVQVSPATIKNYIRRLEDFYLVFSVRPYSTNIKRSLLKTGKYYLYDWSQVKDTAARFENYVACELNTRCILWGELTGDEYSLFYIRNKQKQETDFLILKNRQPWLLIESKLSDSTIDRHHLETMRALGSVPLVQVCMAPGVMAMQRQKIYRISANRLFV